MKIAVGDFLVFLDQELYGFMETSAGDLVQSLLRSECGGQLLTHVAGLGIRTQTEQHPMGRQQDLLQGTLDMLMLRILSVEPMHGWGITQRVEQMSGDVLQVQQGSLYPAMERLSRKGWITSEWRTTENNRRARYYSLTKAGQKRLQAEAKNWTRLSAAAARRRPQELKLTS